MWSKMWRFAARLCPDIAWAVECYRQRDASRDRWGSGEELREAVLDSPTVQAALRQGNAKHQTERLKEANKILDEMAPSPNLITIAVCCYLLRKAFRIMYVFGINVEKEQLCAVRKVLMHGPAVLLPTHKSHLDYVILLYVCFEQQLPMPAVIAGDNLNMPLLGRLLRSCGALFIRRTFAADKDPLYAAVFREYVKQLLVNGHSLEVFIEGGRSRSGKLLQPKTGVLQSVVAAVLDYPSLDVFAIPIALSFDRIVETQSHIAEMAGVPKKAERLHHSLASIARTITTAATQASAYGSVDVRLAEPISVREYVMDYVGGSPKSGTALARAPGTDEAMQRWPFLYYDEDHDEDSIKYIAHTLGYRALYDCNRVSVVLPASLVSTVLLSQQQRGIYREELIAKVFWLRDELKRRQGRVLDVDMNMIDYTVTLVLSGMEGANELVKTHNDRILLSLYKPQERLELILHRNQLLHHFVREAIVACCIYAKEKEEGQEGMEIDVSELQMMNRFLTQLLKLEFIFRPSKGSKGINEHIDLTLKELVQQNTLRFCNPEHTRVGVNTDGGEGGETGTLTYLFLCSLLWPFIDSYWLACLGLYALLPDKAVQDQVLIRKMQMFGESLYFSGMMDLYEAINRFSLENALVLLQKWRVLRVLRVEATGPSTRIVQLHTEYQDPAKIESLVLEISRYRKRSSGYRSRRFRAVHQDEVKDAIYTVKNLCNCKV